MAALPEDTVIDFVFLDADKDKLCRLLRGDPARTAGRTALIAVDNVMWHNWSMDAENQDPETVGIREFNEHVLRDSRVESVMLHVGDGLTLVRKL